MEEGRTIMTYERMLDKETRPLEEDVLKFIGERASLWTELRQYLATHYDHIPELDFGGKKYGWEIRYRKSGKTLVTLYPEKGAFTALVVAGKNEVEKINEVLATLSPAVRDIFQNTKQLHDGRWLWIQPVSAADLESLKTLLSAKRRPRPGQS
jgi:hypothetical protein